MIGKSDAQRVKGYVPTGVREILYRPPDEDFRHD
jgi:hypothetical protein